MTRIPNGARIRRDMFRESADKRCPLCKRHMVLQGHGSKKRPPSNHATLDHIVPRSSGGSDDKANLRLICRSCNAAKADVPPLPTDTPADRQRIALETAAASIGVECDPNHVKLACSMCEALGMDPNVALSEGDPTLNWQFFMVPASVAFNLLRPQTPAGDLFYVPHPDGRGPLMRIDHEGAIHIREGCEPMTPIFTLVNAVGDVTLAVGPPDLKPMPEQETTH